MILARIAFDGVSQQFRLVDPELAGTFQDGEVYLVIIDNLARVPERDFDLSASDTASFDLTDLRNLAPAIGNA